MPDHDDLDRAAHELDAFIDRRDFAEYDDDGCRVVKYHHDALAAACRKYLDAYDARGRDAWEQRWHANYGTGTELDELHPARPYIDPFADPA